MNEDLYIRTEVIAVNCKVDVVDINVVTGIETLYVRDEFTVFYLSTFVSPLYVVS